MGTVFPALPQSYTNPSKYIFAAGTVHILLIDQQILYNSTIFKSKERKPQYEK